MKKAFIFLSIITICLVSGSAHAQQPSINKKIFSEALDAGAQPGNSKEVDQPSRAVDFNSDLNIEAVRERLMEKGVSSALQAKLAH